MNAIPAEYDFSGMDDLGSAPAVVAPKEPVFTPGVAGKLSVACPRCGGSGQWGGGFYRGTCFKCNGSGRVTNGNTARMVNPPEIRAANAEKRRAAKVKKLQKMITEYAESNPVVFNHLRDWMRKPEGGHGFLADLWGKLHQYGFLTDNQTAAVLNGIERDAQRQQERAAAAIAREANAPVLNIGRVEQAFETARGNGIKRPLMRMGGFLFKAAPLHGSNPGSIYITQQGQYLGKVTQGKLLTVRECSETQKTEIVEMCNDPLKAAIAYGQRTGQCSICGRELTNEGSIEAGIGPICAGRYGF